MTVVDRLSVLYDVQDANFRAGMQRMLGLSQRTNDQIAAQAKRAEDAVKGAGAGFEEYARKMKWAQDAQGRWRDQSGRFVKSTQLAAAGLADASRKADQAKRSFGGIGASAVTAAAKVAALGAALGKLSANSQSYKVIENRLRSLGEYSDEAAEKLASAAIRSRAPLEDMAGTVARIQKATGDGYDETIRRVETLNKLMAVGGATASEVNSVVVQLSQALSSGVLQGDELRSLREAAPVELLDAIAKAAGVTRAELKDMGADGKLTSDIIVQALDAMATTADEQFGRTTQTIGAAFTNLNTGLTMFAGRLDEGLGATGAFSDALASMGEWLANNADVAEELGRSIQAALQTGMEIANQAEAALMALSDTVYTELVQGSVFDLGAAFEDSGTTAADVIDAIINAIADMNGTIEGAAAAAREAFLQIPDAISAAMQSAINAVIAGVESMVNGVLDGVRAVAAAVDSVTGAAAGLYGGAGTNIAGGVGKVSLGRVEGLATNLSGGSVGDAYNSGFEKGRGAVLDAVDSVTGFFEGVGETYERNRAELEQINIEAERVPDGVTRSGRAAMSGGGAGGGAGKNGGGRKGRGGAGRGRAGREERPFFEAVEKDLLNLERQMQLIGKTSEEAATLEARWSLLDEAKKRGIPVNETLNAQIDAQAAKVGRLTGELERAEIAQDQFESAIDGIAGAMSDALIEGESLREGLAQVFKQIASDILNSGIRAALMAQFGGQGGAAGGFGGFVSRLFGGGQGGLFSYDGGGFTGSGPRMGGIDGKGGFPAILHPNETVIDHTRGQRSGMSYSPVFNIGGSVTPEDLAAVRRESALGFQQMRREVPGIMDNHQKRRG